MKSTIRNLSTLAALPLLCLLLTGGCEEPETELSRSHAYMDSLRTMLGELRLMDHELNQVIAGRQSGVSAALIVPIVRQKLRPTIQGLLDRTDDLTSTTATADVHDLFHTYLQTRLDAYNLLLQGGAESRPELFEYFGLKQIEAETLGRKLEDLIYKVRSEIPEYN
ncbi:MAG: hypothetical protein HN712_28990 [Gemmatimonadetes bacterium]|nr:hypothetical protein [Gemmatimonadota bacterium]MBT6146024.1 hypothetical protein [Gemmatimonadota bacterium]MBT7864380.1 hypothetical protein [Gemmatimonadota bacterium]